MNSFRQLVDTLDWGWAHRKGSTYTAQHKDVDIHPCLERESNPRSQCSSGPKT